MSLQVLRIICMGMLGEFSAIPVEHMLGAGVNVCAVVVPSPRATSQSIHRMSEPPPLRADLLLQSDARQNIIQLAWHQHIPVFAVSDLRHAQTFATLADLQPDVIVVACFPFILPKRLLHLPKYGCFNLHPALLPKLRGPAPLFWTFHEDVQPGVTLHVMNERVDGGDIVTQTSLEFPEGIVYAQAENICAQAGATLITDTLRSIERGNLQTHPQSEAEASYLPYPGRKDFIVTPDWSARRAFNFLRGIEGFGGPARIHIGAQQFVARTALTYAIGETTPQTYRVEGAELWVQCADGVVHMRFDKY